MSEKLIKMQVFLGFEPNLLSNSEAEWSLVVPKPKVYVEMAGTIDVAAKIWVNWALAKKKRGKLLKMDVFLGFKPFLLSSNEAERR